jgi:hypothetical protein
MWPADSSSINPLIRTKILEQGLSLVKYQKDDKIKNIIIKIFKAGQDVNSSYELAVVENAKLKIDNSKLCEQAKNAEITLSPLAIRPRRVLKTEEKEAIPTAPKGDIIRKFLHKVANASLKFAKLAAENNQLKEENQKLRELLAKKLLLTPIKEDLSLSPTHAEALSPSPKSTPSPTPMLISPLSPSTSSTSSSTPSPTLQSPSTSPQKKVLHPSSEQIEAEKAHPKKEAAPSSIDTGRVDRKNIEWLINFTNVLNGRLNDMSVRYFNPKKPELSSLELFAKFIEEYKKNPEPLIRYCPLDDEDIEALNIGIEYLGGKNKKITVELLKRTIELKDEVTWREKFVEVFLKQLLNSEKPIEDPWDVFAQFIEQDKQGWKRLAKFINQYKQAPSKFKLSPGDIEALNIGIECLGIKNKKITAQFLQSSFEL